MDIRALLKRFPATKRLCLVTNSWSIKELMILILPELIQNNIFKFSKKIQLDIFNSIAVEKNIPHWFGLLFPIKLLYSINIYPDSK